MSDVPVDARDEFLTQARANSVSAGYEAELADLRVEIDTLRTALEGITRVSNAVYLSLPERLHEIRKLALGVCVPDPNQETPDA